MNRFTNTVCIHLEKPFTEEGLSFFLIKDRGVRLHMKRNITQARLPSHRSTRESTRERFQIFRFTKIPSTGSKDTRHVYDRCKTEKVTHACIYLNTSLDSSPCIYTLRGQMYRYRYIAIVRLIVRGFLKEHACDFFPSFFRISRDN